MTWEDLPDGLVDRFRQEAFSLNGEGLIIVRLEQGRFWVKSFRQTWLAHLFDRLDEFMTKHTKADIVILTGRTEKQTGVQISPQVQVRLYGV